MSSKYEAELLNVLNIQEKDRVPFATYVNKFFAETFITYQFERDEYYFIRKYQDQFTAYFSLADWELRHDELGRVFQIVNRHNQNRRALTQRESELLLLLCLTYEEKRQDVHLTETPTMTIADLKEKYKVVLNKDVKRTPLGDSLNSLQTYKLIRSVDGRRFKPTEADQTILLLPTLRLVLEIDKLEDVYKLLTEWQERKKKNAS